MTIKTPQTLQVGDRVTVMVDGKPSGFETIVRMRAYKVRTKITTKGDNGYEHHWDSGGRLWDPPPFSRSRMVPYEDDHYQDWQRRKLAGDLQAFSGWHDLPYETLCQIDDILTSSPSLSDLQEE